MGFKEFTEEGQLNEMKYQALAMAKEIHSSLAQTTFIEMLSVMSTDNPAKKEVQALETELNDLTTKVGEFIQKYIPDVADAEAGDDSEIEDDEEEMDEARAATASTRASLEKRKNKVPLTPEEQAAKDKAKSDKWLEKERAKMAAKKANESRISFADFVKETSK